MELRRVNPPFSMCPYCLADLAVESTRDGRSYRCKECGSVNITVRDRDMDISINTKPAPRRSRGKSLS